MDPRLEAFIKILETENRWEALRFILETAETKELTIPQIYEELLTPALNLMASSGNENIDIWKEHVRTSLIKTILENLYPQVIRERGIRKKSRTVVVLCPPEEYHDIGARMAVDMLTLAGFETVFVGSNTPLRVLEAGLQAMAIDIAAISISNPYHLVSARTIVDAVRTQHPDVMIIAGGSAIAKLGSKAAMLGADRLVFTLKELSELKGGTSDETGI